MASLVAPPAELTRFCRQYLQLERSPCYPKGTLLRDDDAQAFLYEKLFKHGALSHPPPTRYQLRILKELVARIESSIDNWDVFVSSDAITPGVHPVPIVCPLTISNR